MEGQLGQSRKPGKVQLSAGVDRACWGEERKAVEDSFLGGLESKRNTWKQKEGEIKIYYTHSHAPKNSSKAKERDALQRVKVVKKENAVDAGRKDVHQQRSFPKLVKREIATKEIISNLKRSNRNRNHLWLKANTV